MLPSWIRSSIGIWLRPYLRAIETTRRRLALMKRCIARSPSSTSQRSSASVAYLGAPPFLRPTRPSSSSFCGEQAGLDGLGELDLGGGVEQRRAGDLVEVEADAVAALDLTLDAGGGHGDTAPFLQVDRAGVRSAGPALVQRLVRPWDSLRGSPVGATGSPVRPRRAVSPVPTADWAHEVAAGGTSQALLSDPSVPASAESMPARVESSVPRVVHRSLWKPCGQGRRLWRTGARSVGNLAAVEKSSEKLDSALVEGVRGHVEISHRGPQGQRGTG